MKRSASVRFQGAPIGLMLPNSTKRAAHRPLVRPVQVPSSATAALGSSGMVHSGPTGPASGPAAWVEIPEPRPSPSVFNCTPRGRRQHR